jgi:hypothetical protein
MDEKKRAATAERWARFRKALLPDVTTEKGLKAALSCGAGVAIFGSICYAAIFLYAWLSGGEPFGLELDAVGFMATQAVNLFAAIAGLVLAWFISKRASRIAAVLVLIWMVAEAIGKMAIVGAHGAGPAIAFILLATNGVRGAFAKHRLGLSGPASRRGPS